MSLHEPNLEEKVHELLENDDQLNDPYSAAVVGIKASLSYGLEHDGAMNDHEHLILKGLQDMLFVLDPQSNPDYLAPGITGPFIPNESPKDTRLEEEE